MFKYVLLFLAFYLIGSPQLEGAYRSPYLSDEAWESITPYLLPENSKVKAKLDKIFAKTDVLNSDKTLKKAGFDLSRSQKQERHIKVGKHEDLPGYLVKMYTNDQPNFDEWSSFIVRITAAKMIQAAIDAHQYNAIFKVPKKWIYMLPTKSAANQRKCILVVEDMRIYDDNRNYSLWKKTKRMTKEKILALYTLMSEQGLIDSVYIDNIPFSIDGKIAFIDTEHIHVWPVPYHKLTPFIHKDLQSYWLELTR